MITGELKEWFLSFQECQGSVSGDSSFFVCLEEANDLRRILPMLMMEMKKVWRGVSDNSPSTHLRTYPEFFRLCFRTIKGVLLSFSDYISGTIGGISPLPHRKQHHQRLLKRIKNGFQGLLKGWPLWYGKVEGMVKGVVPTRRNKFGGDKGAGKGTVKEWSTAGESLSNETKTTPWTDWFLEWWRDGSLCSPSGESFTLGENHPSNGTKPFLCRTGVWLPTSIKVSTISLKQFS